MNSLLTDDIYIFFCVKILLTEFRLLINEMRRRVNGRNVFVHCNVADLLCCG